MAINKRAKNINIEINDTYLSQCGTVTKSADYLNIESTEENLILASNNKIQTYGKKLNKAVPNNSKTPELEKNKGLNNTNNSETKMTEDSKSGNDFLPSVIFSVENDNPYIKCDETKTQKNLFVYDFIKPDAINYDIKWVEVRPKVREIVLKCEIQKAFDDSIDSGTIHFRIESSEGFETDLMFGDSTMINYETSIGDIFSYNLLITEGKYKGGYHKLIAYIKNGSKEIIVGKINILINQGAWPITRHWDKSDFIQFQDYAAGRLKYYNGHKINCADLGVQVLVDYASEQGLPLEFKNKYGKVFESYSENYSSKNEYLKGYKNNGKLIDGVLSGIQARDIPENTFILDEKEACIGDMKVIEKPWDHLVIYSQIKPEKLLTYGNFDSSTGQDKEVKYNVFDYTYTDTPGYTDSNGNRGTMTLTFTPERTVVHRWFVFK